MSWLVYLHNRTSIFTKVLVANAFMVVIGILLSVLLIGKSGRATLPDPRPEVIFILVGLVVSLAVNYAILRLAFQPLFTLQHTLDQVRRGDFSARVPAVAGDPDIAEVTQTTNLVLNRLAEHRQAVAAQILRAQEAERKRIARELHDETSQSLTSVVVNLVAIEQQMTDGPEPLLNRMRLTKDIAQRTLDETRRLMFDLRPSVLDDLGLVPALRWFISQRVQPAGLHVELQTHGMEERLSEELETAIFRIMQEAITNAVKHARARNLTVELSREPGQIAGLVRDDGRGFSPAAAGSTKADKDSGLGLFGMQERAALVGGTVQIESAPGRGTVVKVIVPDRVGGR